MVIDLTGLGNNQKQEEEEQEVYCQLCPGGTVKMLYCNQDNIDKSQGPLYKKGDHVCPKCGNVKIGKKKEQKGPKITKKASKGFIGMFSTEPDAFKLNSDTEELEDPDELADEMLGEQGAEVHSETFYPASNRTVRSNRK